MKRLPIAILTLSAAGLLAIAGVEGYSDRVTIPVPGDGPTGGWGHKDERLKVGSYVGPQRALKWIKGDTSQAEADVKRCVTAPLYPWEFDAYVSLAYNVGGKKFCDSTLVKKANLLDYAGACAEFQRWIRGPGGVVYKGLQERREMESAMCSDGVYPK